jgi:hypothetical protein
MNFLAFTGLQAALLALVTSGLIIAFYFLKLRHRRVVIASSILWKRVLDEREARSLWERLRRAVSIVLAVVIGLLIALAIGRPEMPWLTGNTSRSVVVLDTSPTMLARTGDGKTRWQHAQEAALRLINASGSGTAIRVADTSGIVDSGFTSDRHQTRTSIERMRPRTTPFQFPALDGSEGAGSEVRFVTDGVTPAGVPEGVSTVSVFQEAPNVGITAFEIRSVPSSPLAYEAYLEVYNYGRQSKQTTITVSGAGRQRITRTADLKAGGVFKEPFDLSRFEGGGIRATVQATGDAFALDDTAYAYLPVKRRTRTLLVTTGNTYLETLLKSHSLVDVTVIKPSEYHANFDSDVFIFDGFAPLDPPPRPALLTGGFQDVGWLPRADAIVQKPRFGSWSEDHPVMRFVSLHDVTMDRAKRVDGTGATVLAESENRTPLILASPASRRPRWIMLTFSLAGSDFPLHPGFPLFVDNALAWFSREPLALRRQPGLVEFDMAGAQVKSIDGTTLPVHSKPDGSVFQVDEPGLYIATDQDSRQHIAVNLASQQYSNINRTSADGAAASSVPSGWLQHELWFYMLGAALVLITVEWFTYHRRLTL